MPLHPRQRRFLRPSLRRQRLQLHLPHRPVRGARFGQQETLRQMRGVCVRALPLEVHHRYHCHFCNRVATISCPAYVRAAANTIPNRTAAAGVHVVHTA